MNEDFLSKYSVPKIGSLGTVGAIPEGRSSNFLKKTRFLGTNLANSLFFFDSYSTNSIPYLSFKYNKFFIPKRKKLVY